MKQIKILALFSLSLATMAMSQEDSWEVINGNAAIALYKSLPGPVTELPGGVSKKQNTEGTVICYEQGFMYGDVEYRCYLNTAQ